MLTVMPLNPCFGISHRKKRGCVLFEDMVSVIRDFQESRLSERRGFVGALLTFGLVVHTFCLSRFCAGQCSQLSQERLVSPYHPIVPGGCTLLAHERLLPVHSYVRE